MLDVAFIKRNHPRVLEGDAQALLQLGLAYEQGSSVSQSNVKAVACYALAAHLGDGVAGGMGARLRVSMSDNELSEVGDFHEELKATILGEITRARKSGNKESLLQNSPQVRC